MDKLDETSKYFSKAKTVFNWWDPENPNAKNGYSSNDRELFEKERLIVIDFLMKQNFNSVLEVGSGRGRFALSIGKMFPNAKIIGIDISKEMVDFSNKLVKENNLKNVEFKLGNANKLDFLPNLFDITICLQVLMHIPNQINVINELIKVTKPNGIIILNQINSNHSWRIKLRGWRNRIKVPLIEFISTKMLRKTKLMFRLKEHEFRDLISDDSLEILQYTTLGIEKANPVYFIAFCKKKSNI